MRLTLAFCILLLTTALVWAGPRFEIPQRVFDFGTVAQQSNVVHQFWFKSTGNDTVRIEKIVTGCQCTMAEHDRDILPPGDSMMVELTWDLGRRLGFVGQYPRVYHNGPESPTSMTIKALVVPAADTARPISAKPYKAELSVAGALVVDSVMINLHNHWDKTVSVSQLSPEIEQCLVELPDSIPANGDAIAKIKILPEFADTDFVNSLTFIMTRIEPESRDNKPSIMTIPIRRKHYN